MTIIRSALNFTAKFALVSVVACTAVATHAEGRFMVSADGQEVTDTTTKLVWRRCVEGMSWDGKTCTGKAKKMNFVAAQKLTAGNTTPAWRIPTKEELVGLVDKAQKKTPKIDAIAFPNTPNGLAWAGRPEMKDNLNAWIVDFRNGHVFGNTGSKAPVLRLVRSAG